SPASLVDSSYAAAYAKDYAEYVAKEAAAELRAAEVQATQVLLRLEGGSESAPVTDAHSAGTVAEAPVTVSDSHSLAAPVPIGIGRDDSESIIASHPQVVQGDWTAQLISSLDDGDAPQGSTRSSEMRLAAASLEKREPDLESAAPVAGALSI